MGLRVRRDWVAFAAGVLFGLMLLVGWAWHDGGERAPRPISATATLPEPGQ